MSSRPLDLVRGIGPWATMAMVVGHMIGTGIFLVPSIMAQRTGGTALVFGVWIFGAALTLCGALAWAELAAAIPETGGSYAYLKRAFGPLWGFLFGWTQSTVGKAASISGIAAGLLKFTGFIFPAVATPLFAVRIPLFWSSEPYVFTFTWAQPLAVAAIWLISGVNYVGVRQGGRVQVLMTVLKLGAIGALVVFGFLFGKQSETGFEPLFPQEMGTAIVGGFLLALVSAMWAYDGWNDVTLAAAEVKDPQKNLPRAQIGGVAIVACVYILANAVYFYVLPFHDVAASEHVASDVVATFAGHSAGVLITIAMMISALGTLNSSILTGARVPYALARDGVFFRVAGGIHPVYRTPANALIFQACLASVLALTGTFEELLSLFIFSQWIFYGLTVAAVYRLRHTEPDLPRPYRCIGYPVVPALFIAGAVALTVNLWVQSPGRSSIGLGLILVGLVFYRRWSAMASKVKS